MIPVTASGWRIAGCRRAFAAQLCGDAFLDFRENLLVQNRAHLLFEHRRDVPYGLVDVRLHERRDVREYAARPGNRLREARELLG